MESYEALVLIRDFLRSSEDLRLDAVDIDGADEQTELIVTIDDGERKYVCVIPAISVVMTDPVE
jgi:hypothetical protein